MPSPTDTEYHSPGHPILGPNTVRSTWHLPDHYSQQPRPHSGPPAVARFYPKVDLIPGPVPYSRLQVPPPYNCRVLVLGPRPPGKSTSPSALTLSPHALGSSPLPSAQVPPTPFPLARPTPPPRYSHPTPFHLRYHTPLPTARSSSRRRDSLGLFP
ncbi:hypothetical protein B0J15DRAFT_41279 [Fusarium solani]|uniref:Uncharacterized protein n=1 Tax=Fusarium solani TaxID=169388 RepID=A0A9P9K779_FUSSL|nr:uncharacterized protein B0J15DRAFT_41279 [Fusarium solani]KAH7250423.1 hypothetical protein B0J15DRAFT_41279 [Fusarium solani]